MTLVKFKRPAGNRYITSPFFPATMNDIFDNFLTNNWPSEDRANFLPATNIAEDDKAFIIELSAPGFNKTDVKVEVENNTLTITGEHKEEKKEDGKNFTRKEFNYGSFKRSFTLPENVNTDSVEAKYENGILNIVLPKKMEEKNTAVKEVKVG